jgi:hypothetical protein
VGDVDRARQRPEARLDDDRELDVAAGGDGLRRREPVLLEQLVGRDLVVGRAGDLGVGDHRRQPPVPARLGEDLDVGVDERKHGADLVLGDERLQRGHELRVVVGREVVDLDLGGVLRRREAVEVARDDRRVLRERRHDVVASAHAGEQHRTRAHFSAGSRSCGTSVVMSQPPPSPL